MSGGYRGKIRHVKLRCTECGNEAFIWRRRCKLKEKGHIKHLWCIRCMERTPHVEIREDS